MKEKLMIDKLIFSSIESKIAISDNLSKLINAISRDEFKMFVPITSMSKSEYENLNLG